MSFLLLLMLVMRCFVGKVGIFYFRVKFIFGLGIREAKEGYGGDRVVVS